MNMIKLVNKFVLKFLIFNSLKEGFLMDLNYVKGFSAYVSTFYHSEYITTTLYTCAVPDSLQCASFKIPKLYDIFEMNSDILVLYKCKSQCKSCFTSVKRNLHCALHFILCITLVHYKCKAL